MDYYSKAYSLFGKIRGYRRFCDMHYSLRRFEKSEVAKEHLRIINFYEHHGERATKDAFGMDRRLISRWRKRLEESGGSLSALVPQSTRPHQTRRSDIPLAIIDFIRGLREKYPRLGKEKIKPLLDEYCEKTGLATISESTIGNIIKRHKFFYQKSGRAYHNPSSKWAQKRVKRAKRLRVRYSPKPKEFGYIISDTVELVIDGIKQYFCSAMDAGSRFALTLPYERLNSRNMKDLYLRFKQVYPLKIKCWQTDNGQENLGEFDETLNKDGIPHLFIYPRCCKTNSLIERYNRTIQEEFIYHHIDMIWDKPLFAKELAEYLIFYNAKRPHKSLGLKSPLKYMIETGSMSQMYLTYTLC